MLTFPNKPQVEQIIYTSPFRSRCRIDGKRISGEIEWSYLPKEVLLDVLTIEEWVKALPYEEVIVEEVARLALDAAVRALGDIPVHVTVVGRTTGHAPLTAHISNQAWRDQ